jgi:hypothetical protein
MRKTLKRKENVSYQSHTFHVIMPPDVAETLCKCVQVTV